MLTQKQLRVFGMLASREQSFSDLKRSSGGRSHSALQRAVAAFRAQGLVLERRIGPTRLYRLDDRNDETHLYRELAAYLTLGKRSHDVHTVSECVTNETPFCTIVVFGSHATVTQTSRSDLDIAVIVPDEEHKHKASAGLRAAANRTILTLDGHAMTQEEFLGMLTAQYETLGKEIARTHLPVHNSHIFYNLLQSARAHGWDHDAVRGTRGERA